MPLPGEIYNLAAQKFEAVPEEDIEDRVREGTHAFGTGIKVPVVDENGSPWFIPSEEVPDALAQGYQIETTADTRARELREKYASGSWNKLRAFFEETGRSATFGGTDVLARAVGVPEEALAARKEALTTGETIAADVLGIGSTLFVPGSPVARVAQAGTKVTQAAGAALRVGARTGAARVAARAVEAAAGTAIEGAAYASGMVISEAALGDKELTASRVAGEIGMVVLLGGGFGIAGAAAGAGVSKFKAALAEALDPEKVAKLAGRAAGKGAGLGAKAGQLEKKGLNYGEVGSYAMNEPQAALGGGTIMRTGADGAPATAIKPRTMQKNARLAKQEAGERMDTLAGEIPGPTVDLAGLYRPPTPAKPAVPDRIVEEATGLLDDAGRPIMRQRVIPGSPAEPAVPGGEMWKIVDDLYDPAMKDLRESVAAKLTEWAKDFAEMGPMSFARAVKHERDVSSHLRNAYGKLSPTPALDQAKSIRHELSQHINERYAAEARRLGKDPDAWLKANKDYGWSKEIEKAAGDLANRREGQPVFGFGDRLVAFAIGAPILAVSPAWATSALVGAAMNKGIREYGGQITAAALDRVSKFDFLQRSAAAAEKRMRAAIEGATGKVKKPRLLNPAAINFPEQAFLEAGDSPGTPGNPNARFEANVRLIDRYATNPELLADALDKSLAPIQDVAPNVANSIAMRAARAIMYLHQEAPRPPVPANALSKPPPVSDMDRATFESKFRAVDLGPVGLLEDAASGVADPVAVAALEVADPIGLEDARQRLLDALAEGGGEDLDYDRLVALGVILGASLATTLEPGVIASLQAAQEQQAAGLEQAQMRLRDIDIGSEAVAGESEAWERRRA